MSAASSEPSSGGVGETKHHKILPVPWNPWLAIVFLVVIYYGAQLLAGAIVSIYPSLMGWTTQQGLAWLTDSVAAQFSYIFLAEALTLGALFWFLKRYKLGFGILGLRRPRWRDAGLGLLSLPVYYLFYLVTVAVVSATVPGLDINQAQDIGFENARSTAQLVLVFISLAILPPITEEILVRGFLYSSLKKALPTIGAVITTSAIFATAHLPAGGAAGPLYIAAIDTFVLSLVLIYLREKTGSLWASITLHSLKNSVAFVVLFVLHLA